MPKLVYITPTPVKFDLEHALPGTVERLIKCTQKHGRLTTGQKVQFVGPQRNIKGDEGVLVGMGAGGEALVKSGKDITPYNFKMLAPVGAVKPYSIYDNIEDRNIYLPKGKARRALKKSINTRIGSSNFTYKILADTFRAHGHRLILVGGAVRDIVQGKTPRDLDFICDCSDHELRRLVAGLNQQWVYDMGTGKHWVLNDLIGLVSFSDGNDSVDITPIHRYIPEIDDEGKGWSLKEDAGVRDLTYNSLQYDPEHDVIIDATGKGIQDLQNNEVDFCNRHLAAKHPEYLLRAILFIVRGSSDRKVKNFLKANLKKVAQMPSVRLYTWIKHQLIKKSGMAGVTAFKNVFSRYVPGGFWAENVQGAVDRAKRDTAIEGMK